MAVNGNTPLPVEQFGGLRLDVDPSELGWNGAMDLRDVDFDRANRLRSRYGSERFTAAAAAGQWASLFSYSPTRLLAGRSGETVAMDSASTVVATTPIGAFTGAANVGTTAQTECYLAYGGAGAMRVYNGVTMATPTATVTIPPAAPVAGLAMPLAYHLGVTPWDNRLVAAHSPVATGGPGSTASSSNHVHFSDPGAPQVWNSNNYVILSPGDGGSINAVVSWRDLLFVFKDTKYFVFNGTSTDSQGLPIFNYQTIDAGVGASSFQRVVAAKDGVYFMDRRGIYRTRGFGEPEKISEAIDPVFSGQAAQPVSFFQGVTNVQAATLSASDDKLFVNTQSGQLFVYDFDTQIWTYWYISIMTSYAMVQHAFTGLKPVMYFTMSNSNDIARFMTSGSTDQGAAITSWYRSGFATPGGPGSEATIRETLVEGAGSVIMDWARDYAAPYVPSQQTLTLSTPPAQGRAMHRKAMAGEGLSFQLWNTSSAVWQVNRLTPYRREVRGPGEKTA